MFVENDVPIYNPSSGPTTEYIYNDSTTSCASSVSIYDGQTVYNGDPGVEYIWNGDVGSAGFIIVPVAKTEGLSSWQESGGNIYNRRSVNSAYEVDGETLGYWTGGTAIMFSNNPSPILSGTGDGLAAYFRGDEIVIPTEYPEGTSGWSNSSWSPTASTEYPTYNVPDPSTGTNQPYYPVSPFIGDDPGTSPDPETTPQQDPTLPISPTEWPVIDPYIPPVVNPEIQIPDTPEFPTPDPDELTNPGVADDPVYIPTPNLDPSIDPAADPAAEPESVLQPDPPPSSGISPPIIFPVPDVPFPSIVPQGSDTPVASGSPGFIQVYNPTTSEFIAFGRWLWVTYADATLQTIWNNPFDGVIGAHELYATPSKDGYSTIRSGFLDSGISSIIVRQRYTEINCGSILIPEYWGNYLDYSPYSRAYIYLPFIGIMDLDVDDIVGHAVNVLYHIDSYTGACIAQITVARDGYSNTVYQFSGDCSVEIPMAGGSQANIKAAMIAANAYQNAANIAAGMSLFGGIASGLASAIGGALMPGVGSTIGGITSGIGQAIGGYASSQSQKAYGEAQHTAAMVSQKSNVQHSGSFGSSHGAMGIKKPYIIIRRPIQKVVNGYNKLYGYPAHKMVVIGNCTGYLRCREVHVVSSLATDEEKSMIEEMLKTGVYVTE